VGLSINTDLESIVLVATLPREIAVQFPEKDEDETTPHITVWYQGALPGNRFDEFEEACRIAVAEHGAFDAELTGEMSYFEHADQRVAFAEVRPEDAFQQLFLSIQRETMIRGIVSESEYYQDAWSYRPHSAVAYLRPGEIYYQACPVGSFRVTQLEMWGIGVPLLLDLSPREELVQKGWNRAYSRMNKKTGERTFVGSHWDKRTKQPEPPPKRRKQAATKQSEPQMARKHEDLKDRIAQYSKVLHTVKNPEHGIDLGKYSTRSVKRILRQQLGAAVIKLHQHRIDRADALTMEEGQARGEAKTTAGAKKIVEQIRTSGGKLHGMEFSNGTMHAKIVKEDGTYKTQIFDENGVAAEHEFAKPSEAIMALAKRGYSKAAGGTMDKLKDTVKWLYGNRAAESIKHAEQLRAGGNEFGASEIERQFLETNGTNEDEMVQKDELQQRVSKLFEMGLEDWDKALKQDPAEASEVAQTLKKQDPGRFGEHEKRVEKMAVSELLSPEEVQDSILMRFTLDATRRDLMDAENKFKQLVNGQQVARLKRTDVNKLAKQYINQINEEFRNRGMGDVGSVDSDPFVTWAKGMVEDPATRPIVKRVMGQDYVDLLKLSSREQQSAERRAVQERVGGDPWTPEFIENCIKVQAIAALRDKSTTPVTSDITLPVAVIDHNGKDVDLPMFNDPRIEHHFGDAEWSKAAVESIQHSATEQQKYLDNWRDGFDDLVDVSRKIMALRYQLKDPDFHESDDGRTASELLDHLSRKREEIWGVKTPETKAGDFGDVGRPQEEMVPF